MPNPIFLHINFWEYQFHSPQLMWLLVLVPILLFLHYKKQNKTSGKLKFSRLPADLDKISFAPMKWIIPFIYLLLAAGTSLLILALAQPYLPISDQKEKNYAEGIDIMISMDVSGSMLATDFLPNRLEAAKAMAKEFVDGRTNDRIGYVVFEGEAYTACPATQNYDYLKSIIEETQTGQMESGTAIGTGLGTAVARLRSDSLVSKVIILLTDGESNRGTISPMAAAEMAKAKNIKVYTIGVGKKGYANIPVQTPFGTIVQKMAVNIDEDLLTEMAELTGGQYFRATDENSLRSIYHTINQMEKREIVNEIIQRSPPYKPDVFLFYGFLLLCLGILSEQLFLRKNDAP